jgi:hypothetical protein
VGGNIGTYASWLALEGYRVLSFEPMPANEPLIRSNLCRHDPEQSLVGLFTLGLGRAPALCDMWTGEGNMGDGRVLCNDSDAKPQPLDHFQGRMQVRAFGGLGGGMRDA